MSIVEWEMKELKEDEIPTCETPKEIIDYVMTITSKVLPNTFSIENAVEGFKSTKMNEAQIAYCVAKTVYEMFDQMSDQDAKNECNRCGIVLKRRDKQSHDAWSSISIKYDNKYCICELMSIKNQAEVMMVNEAFRLVESNPKLRSKLTQDKEKYEYIKAKWEHPAVRKQIIDLAFKLKV